MCFFFFLQELAESMTELAFLGSLLGMPSIFDPMFPATYATFFGSYPSWMNVGTQGSEPKVMEKNSEDSGDVFVSPMISNVCYIFSCLLLLTLPTRNVPVLGAIIQFLFGCSVIRQC
jgi:hypothetical protein